MSPISPEAVSLPPVGDLPLSSHSPPSRLPARVPRNTDARASIMSSTLLPNSTLPIVIPQTSRAHRGVYYSPFLRAYPETLEAAGITKAEFVHFIDDLNEAFISSPFFYGVMLAGTMMSFVPELAAQVAGGVVATLSSFASTANSHVRTKNFVRKANTESFGPRGLQVRLLNTKNMLDAIGVDEETFKLPPLPDFNVPKSEQGNEDPRRRWLQALENNVSPLDYDVPEISEQDSWFKRAGTWTAKHQDKRQAKSLTRRREKAREQIEAAQQEAAKNEAIIESAIEGLQAELYAQQVEVLDDPDAESKRHRNVADCARAIDREHTKLMNERAKKQDATDKAVSKVDRKEHKVVQRIRWIVITPMTGTEVADEDIDDGVEGVHPLKH